MFHSCIIYCHLFAFIQEVVTNDDDEDDDADDDEQNKSNNKQFVLTRPVTMINQ